MSRMVLVTVLAVLTLAPAAQAADCGAVLDELSKAVIGDLNMSGDKKAAMLRMAMSGYDHCMAGDSKYSSNVRDDLMKQLKAHLGSR